MEFAIPALKGRANPTPITAHRLSGCYVDSGFVFETEGFK
jgi:hypothetical protein